MAVVGELAIGVVSSFIFEAVKRPVQLIRAEYKRKDKITKAIEGTPLKGIAQENLHVALADLTRIIANSQGFLDKNVANFIRELRKTVIPETIVNAILCGSSTSEIFPAYDEFYQRFGQLPFASRHFFDALVVACEERVNNVSDVALLEIVRAQHRQLISDIDKISRALRQQSATGSVTFSELREGRLKVARAVEATNRYTNVESLQGTKRLKLKSLAIPGRVTYLSNAEIASAKINRNSQGGDISYLNFRRQFRRAVILGDPGGGKSTLTQMLCNDLSNLVALEDVNPGRKEYDPSDLKLPLRVILRSFEAKNTADPSYSIFDYLVDEAKIPLDNDINLSRRLLQNWLCTGEAMLIFDGLDEVLELGKRRSIVSMIEQFSEIYAACSVLVTSRLVGYRDAPLSEEFLPYGLAKFLPEEISKYASKSIKAVSGSTLGEANAKAIEFLRQTSKVGGDLRQNPLMLGLMVQIFVYRGDVPSNRPEVYKECATLMFEKWDGRRDIVVGSVPKDDMELLDVFGYVANRTFGDAQNEEGVSKDWLTKELRIHFEGWYIDKASANRAAKSLVDFLTGRAWVMSEVGSGVFKFTHRTFLEYFFARHLLSESDGIGDLLREKLLPHILKNEWAVISHLALHMAIFRDGGKAKQAADIIVKALADETVFPAAQELALLEFIASSLEYLIIPEGVYVDIVTRLAKRAILIGAREDLAAMSVMWTILQNSGNRTTLALKAFSEIFSFYLEGAPSPELLFCVYLLGSKQREASFRAFATGRRPAHNIAGKLESSLEQLKVSHEQILFSLAKQNINVAKAYIYAFGNHQSELYRLHGLPLITPSLSPLVPPGVDGFLSTALNRLTTSMLTASRTGTRVDENSGELISAVANDYFAGSIARYPLSTTSGNAPAAIRDNVEEALAELWRLSLRVARTQKQLTTMAEIFVVITLIIDAFSENRDSVAARKARRDYFFAPFNIFERLVGLFEKTKYNEVLTKWLAKNSALLMEHSIDEA